ncbi:MAG: (d)CMP kinase [Clostridia bacterium]|nr:(d)CMP kinase [Clostridia bacterium]
MKPFVIGISGASGSGKSTLTDALVPLFEKDGRKTAVFGADRYFRKELPRMISPTDGKEYPDWNHPDSFDAAAMLADLEKARDGGEYGAVIFEGVTVFCHPALRDFADVKIWVDASIETRIARRIARNVVSKGQTVEFIADYYLRCARYRERQYSVPSRVYADFTVGNDYGTTIDAAAVYEEILVRANRKMNL